ncbi:hypothetical protein TNCV_2642771 [Trichonephila clavipes]|nr:hypothetical protein TNCV_2642771 [Trichonephila clavipes]
MDNIVQHTEKKIQANAFAVKRDSIRMQQSEKRASDASKEARTTHLEKRTSEDAFREVEERPMHIAEIAD